MKSQNHILKVLLLVAIYSFGIYSSAKILPSSRKVTTGLDNKQKEYASAKVLFPHAQQFKVSISSCT